MPLESIDQPTWKLPERMAILYIRLHMTDYTVAPPWTSLFINTWDMILTGTRKTSRILFHPTPSQLKSEQLDKHGFFHARSNSTIFSQPHPQELHSTHYLTCFSPWKGLSSRTFIFIQPEEVVWKALSHSRCFVASKGSAPQDQSSFAWILSNNKGKRLVQCRGSVLGHAISFYQAECFGMLFILRF